MRKAVLGLGCNLGDRRENLNRAVQALNHLPGTKVLQLSKWYETEPFDVPDKQADYLNLCVLLETELSPHALLGACLGIEAAMGRERKTYHAARVLDMDLLLYEGEYFAEEELNLPHPGILERAFVLVPLADLFPQKMALGLDFSSVYDRMDKSGVQPF